jgi:hypothetical protein
MVISAGHVLSQLEYYNFLRRQHFMGQQRQTRRRGAKRRRRTGVRKAGAT